MKNFMKWLFLTMCVSWLVLLFIHAAVSFIMGDWSIHNWTIVRMVIVGVIVGTGIAIGQEMKKGNSI